MITLWKTINTVELANAISNIKPFKALGEDNLHGYIIVLAYPYIQEVLLKIYNECFKLDYFPSK